MRCPAASVSRCKRVAQALGVYVVFPSYERGAERGTVYNSAALIGPIG